VFDIGFSEMVLIGLVALVVIGPERLPMVARTVGTMLGRMQRYVNDVKSEVEREMRVEELRKLQSNVEEQARSIERTVKAEMTDAEQSIRKVADEAAHEPTAAAALSSDPPAEATSQGELDLRLGDGRPAAKQA
jgi:sec-independent protein translocase protein TatB